MKLIRATKGHSPLLHMDIRLQGQSGTDSLGDRPRPGDPDRVTLAPGESKGWCQSWAAPSARDLTALAHLVHCPRGRTETVGAPASPDCSTSVISFGNPTFLLAGSSSPLRK